MDPRDDQPHTVVRRAARAIAAQPELAETLIELVGQRVVAFAFALARWCAWCGHELERHRRPKRDEDAVARWRWTRCSDGEHLSHGAMDLGCDDCAAGDGYCSFIPIAPPSPEEQLRSRPGGACSVCRGHFEDVGAWRAHLRMGERSARCPAADVMAPRRLEWLRYALM